MASTSLGIVFDGDDTLWSTEVLYDETRSEVRALVASAGLDGAYWESVERGLDLQNAALLGFSSSRFPLSCVQAYELVCQAAHEKPDRLVAIAVKKLAQSVFERAAVPNPSAPAVLEILRNSGYRLALLTKGDSYVQRRRIEESGLAHLFDIVNVVPDKAPATILRALEAIGVEPGSAWIVGNSMRSDVIPALQIGMRAIWIPAHVWEYERSLDHLVDERVVTVPHLSEVPRVLRAS